MKRIVVLSTAALSCAMLAGCSTLSDAKVGGAICSHKITLTIAANAVLKDPKASTLAINVADAQLALVAACPGGPVTALDPPPSIQ